MTLMTIFCINFDLTATTMTDMVIEGSATSLTKIVVLWIYRFTVGTGEHIRGWHDRDSREVTLSPDDEFTAIGSSLPCFSLELL